MTKMEDIYRSPGRDCKKCGGKGVVMEGSRANPQERPCPECNPEKREVPFV